MPKANHGYARSGTEAQEKSQGSVALTGEYFPLARRSTAITFIYCGLSFGQLSAGEVSNAVLQPFGWQAALWVGGALAMLSQLGLP